MADKTDAALIIQLAQWGSSIGVDDALGTVMDDHFNPATASVQDKAIRTLLNYGETIGTLTKNGLLDTDLVLDWLWVAGVWAKVGPAAIKSREKLGVPEMWENIEALAAKQSS